MTVTIGLCVVAVLLAGGFVAYRFLGKTAPEQPPVVVRVTRKNRPLRKPTREHVGRRSERP